MLGLRSPTWSACPPRRGWASTSAGARRTGRSRAGRGHAGTGGALRARRCPGDTDHRVAASCAPSREPQVWLTLLAGAIGFGGMFAVYSYIAPDVTEVGGPVGAAVPVFLLAFGLGMVGGHLAGRGAGRLVGLPLAAIGAVGMACCSCSSWLWRRTAGRPLPVVFLITALGSVLVVNLQLRLMDVAGDAQTLGRRDEPRLPQRRQRARRVARRPGDRRRWGYRAPGRRGCWASELLVLGAVHWSGARSSASRR